jgi:hypothetical protein
LIPFFSLARTADDRYLEQDLLAIKGIRYVFWPRWKPVEFCAPRTPDDPDRQTEDAPPGSEPELVLEITYEDERAAWLLIEAKLYSGKSSQAGTGSSPTDQLGKYWVQLQQRTRGVAFPLGIVYLTQHIIFPRSELEDTQRELVQKGLAPAPLYWLSWRQFVDAVRVDEDPTGLLRDVVELMRARWRLLLPRLNPWPDPPRLPAPWSYGFAWNGMNVPEPRWSYEEGRQ